MRTVDWVKFATIARAHLGRPYKFGGKLFLGDPAPDMKIPVDCSGFTRHVYSCVGIYIPEGSGAQYVHSYPADAAVGVLGFFKDKERVYHVGLLLDEKNVIEARAPEAGKDYGRVILRPRRNWELYPRFSGWRWPDAIRDDIPI